MSGPDDPRQVAFLGFLRQLECDRLILLGDIFQHWWHFPRGGGVAVFPQYAAVVQALGRFEVTFIGGNHDFRAAAFFAGSTAEVREVWDGTAVRLTHGDEVDDSAGYRIVSVIVRGAPFATLVTAMGSAFAWRFLAAITHEPQGAPVPKLVSAQRTRAAEHIAAGADLVVMGHTHAPELTRVGTGWFANLGDWVRHKTYLVVEGGVPQLLSWDGSDQRMQTTRR